ncbi:hypothetical protein FAGKG844_1080002 [Frankia sp. AgKG'84/4]
MSTDRRPLPVAHRYSSGWGGRGSHLGQQSLHGRTGRGPARPGARSRPRDQGRCATPQDRQRRLLGAGQHRRRMARKQAEAEAAPGRARHTTPAPKRMGRLTSPCRRNSRHAQSSALCECQQTDSGAPFSALRSLVGLLCSRLFTAGGHAARPQSWPWIRALAACHDIADITAKGPAGQRGSGRYDFGRTPRQTRISSGDGCRPKPARKVVEQLSGHSGRTAPPPAVRILRPGRRGSCAPP